MKILLSPAKSLDFETVLPTTQFTQPSFLKHSRIINKELKTKKPADLSELMSISDALAQLNWQRNKAWKTPFSPDNARPAVYAFSGDVYVGLDAYSLSEDKLPKLQERVRILSGLYGLLKPLDLMQAYRLEMGTKFPVSEHKDLYAYWKPLLTQSINKELKKGELLINLASNEYASAVQFKDLKVPVITCDFLDYKDGKLKMISFFAKKARGLMTRYIIDHEVETLEELKGFNYEGYGFDAQLSSVNKLVFTR